MTGVSSSATSEQEMTTCRRTWESNLEMVLTKGFAHPI